MKKTPPATKKAKIDIFAVQEPEALLTWLIAKLPHKPRNTIKAVLRDRQISVDGKPITQFDYQLKAGQQVTIQWNKLAPKEQVHGLDIVYEDDDLIIIDKPSGLLTVATDKEKRKTAYSMLSRYLKAENPDNKIFIIHRLDRETSGLMMFAKNEAIKLQIQETWATTISQRTYVAVVEGQMTRAEGTVTSWLTESRALIVYSSQNPRAGRKSITHYKTLQSNDSYSLLQLNLETGRKHQIRVHMQDLEHPVIGDRKYGASLNPIKRMGLHAQVLAFTHPKTGEICRFETQIPNAFLRVFSKRKPRSTSPKKGKSSR